MMLRRSVTHICRVSGRRCMSTDAVKPPATISSRAYDFFTNPGLYITLFVGGIGTFLYVGKQERENREAVEKKISSLRVMSFVEADDIQRTNNDLLTVELFTNCLKDLDATFPTGRCSADDFVNFIIATMERNGADIRNLNLKNMCHFERMLLFLEIDEGAKAKGIPTTLELKEKGLVPTRRLMAAMALATSGSVQQKLRALFELYGRNSETDNLSRDEFKTIVQDLISTSHFPVQYQLTELKSDIRFFGINQWRECTADEMVARGLATREREMKIAPQESIGADEFIAMLSSSPLCIWEECYMKRKRQKLITDIKTKDVVEQLTAAQSNSNAAPAS